MCVCVCEGIHNNIKEWHNYIRVDACSESLGMYSTMNAYTYTLKTLIATCVRSGYNKRLSTEYVHYMRTLTN